jgi:NAD-dependent deacetylase
MNGENDEPTDVLPLEKKSLNDCCHIVVLTGAGVSVASGIAPFRGPGGLWNDPNIEKLAYRETLDDDPVSAWKFYNDLRRMAQNAKPNAAHVALAQFEQNLREDREFLLITQNVDGLHQKAGSKNVLEIHGSIHRTKCSNYECSLARFGFQDKRIYAGPPHCPRCGSSVLRPDLVLFGEMIDPDITVATAMALRDCDLFIAVGTSGAVSPANQFVRAARNAGATTIYINMEPLESSDFDETIIGRAEEELPLLLSAKQLPHLLDSEFHFSREDRDILASQKADPNATCHYETHRGCLFWSDEMVWSDEIISHLSPRGKNLLDYLIIARGLIHRGERDFSNYWTCWQNAIKDGVKWIGFERIKLNAKDAAYLARCQCNSFDFDQ